MMPISACANSLLPNQIMNQTSQYKGLASGLHGRRSSQLEQSHERSLLPGMIPLAAYGG
jgi:hypothetical protein